MVAKFAVEALVTLLVIIDPVGNVPTFLVITRGRDQRQRRRLAGQAVLVATAVLAIFALAGGQILGYLGISIPALEVSGGLLLLIVALELLRGNGNAIGTTEEGISVAVVPLATPLIAGPGAIAAVLVLARRATSAPFAAALAGALLATMVILYLALRYAPVLVRVLKESGIALLTRVFGLLLAAIAVQLAAAGVKGFGF
jgi:multiple antibiotic resistance protein